MHHIVRAWVVVSVICGSVACASVQPHSYAPQPARVVDPAAEIAAIAAANPVHLSTASLFDVKAEQCATTAVVGADDVVITAVCPGITVAQTAHLRRIDHIALVRGEAGWFRLVATHTEGDDFVFTSARQDDVERLADALTALSQRS